MKPSIKEICVSMLIIGKTLGENLSSTAMERNNVQIGAPGLSYKPTKRVVYKKISASILMDGRSKSTIQVTTSLIHAETRTNALKHTVLTSMTSLIRDKLLLIGSKYSLRPELLTFLQTTICHT
jgi:hypothetical protein